MHRNLKPDNILINERHEFMLTDFTLARLMTPNFNAYTPEDPKERERSGREARRLWYRAPELLLRKVNYSQVIDMWSIGCLMAEIATSQALFDGDSEIEQLFKIFSFLGSPSRTVLQIISEDQPNFKLSPMPQWTPI